jgi:DNA polymerase-1
MKLLLDADMLLFRACSSAAVIAELDDDVWVNWVDGAKARAAYWEYVATLSTVSGVAIEDAVHCFTSRSQFRRDLFPAYKASRKGEKPWNYKALLQEILQGEQYAYQMDQIEADDLLGIFAGMFRDEGYVIASGDKDLNQIPGHHVWLDKELTYIDDDAAQRFFYAQVLTGDSVDGIPGCPSVGEKTAEPIIKDLNIDDPVECWETIVSVYAKKGKVDRPREHATTQARLVRILRAGDYDFSTHQVKLWTPPTPNS